MLQKIRKVTFSKEKNNYRNHIARVCHLKKHKLNKPSTQGSNKKKHFRPNLNINEMYLSISISFMKDIVLELLRSSHRRCSVKKGVLRKFAKFTGKHLCQSLFFNKVAAPRPATQLKRSLWHRCFPVNFVKQLVAACGFLITAS